NISATGSAGQFDINFDASLGTVSTIVPEIVPLVLAGGTGADKLRVQSLFEDTFWKGGGGADDAQLNLNALTLAPFNPTDVVAHVDITPLQTVVPGINEKELITLPGSPPATPFHLTFIGQATADIPFTATAADIQNALSALSSVGADNSGAANVNVTQSGAAFTVEFVGALANGPQPLLTADAGVTTAEAQHGVLGQHQEQQLTLRDVTGGTFGLGVSGSPGVVSDQIAWDAPATAVRDAIAKLLTSAGTPGSNTATGAPNVGVTQSGSTYVVEYINDLANTGGPALTSNVVVGTSGGGSVQTIALPGVTTGTFSHDFTYD